MLIPRAEVARETLPEQLRENGATVDVIPVYRTIAPEADLNRLKARIESGAIDAVTFTSSSTVRNFVDMVGGLNRRGGSARKQPSPASGPLRRARRKSMD